MGKVCASFMPLLAFRTSLKQETDMLYLLHLDSLAFWLVVLVE